MFGIGSGELLLILVAALLVLGPKKLPEVARTLGKAMGELRRVSTEFQRTLNTEIAVDDDNREREARKPKFAAEPAETPIQSPVEAPAQTSIQTEDNAANVPESPADPAFGQTDDDQPDAATGGSARKDNNAGAA